jgi:hypothetical protein
VATRWAIRQEAAEQQVQWDCKGSKEKLTPLSNSQFARPASGVR